MKGCQESIIYLFDKVLEEITAWENVECSTTKNCIIFLHHKTFLIMKPLKKTLELKFYSPTHIEELKTIKWGKKYEIKIRIEKEEQFNHSVKKMILDSYEFN